MPEQLVNTVGSLVPGAPLPVADLASTISPASHGFSNNADLKVFSTPHVKELTKLADEFAERVVTERASLAVCLEGEQPDASCVSGYLESFLPRAFRRPTEPAEVDRYTEFFEQEAAADALVGFRQLVRAIFLSPNFQFRTELGPGTAGTVNLTPYERASVISYSLSDGPPDEQLMAAAASNALATSTQVAEQVRRLTSTPGGASGVKRFLLEHFALGAVIGADKDSDLFPAWTPELRSHLVEESSAFFEEVLWNDDARLTTVLTADYTMTNDAVAPLYGLQPAGSGEFRRALLPAGERSGVLTQAAFLASHAGFEEPDITKRGHFVRAILMCQELPPPPPDVPPIPEAEGLSRRERLETIHTEDPVCETCHVLMDPIGYAFENYDAIGRWQTTEIVDGITVPVDTSGTIVNTSLGDLEVRNALELGQTLSALPDVQACFVERFAEFLAGGTHPNDACRVNRASAAFQSTTGSILESAVTLLSDEEFFQRVD